MNIDFPAHSESSTRVTRGRSLVTAPSKADT